MTTRAILGQGTYRYEATDWGTLPDGFGIGDVGGVAVDSRDNVYVFNRSDHPLMVFDRDGNFLRSWGEGVFARPHGISIGRDDAVWCTDDGDHSIRKFTTEGRLLLTLGIPGQPAPRMSGLPFHRCTHTAQAPGGEIYVSDGYGNARVHKYDPDGKFLMSWGEPGIDPGQFNVPHNICCDDAGWVYVADRENHRVQVFDAQGRFETEWNHLHRPCALCASRGADPVFYVGEVPPGMEVNRHFSNLGARVSVVSAQGRILSRAGDEGPGHALGRFVAPHGMAVDSHGDLYVGEVSRRAWPTVSDEPVPAALRTLRKLVRRAGP